MGARPYDPAIGRLLSVDPVEGGSFNGYDYALQDSVNMFDLDGRTCSSLGLVLARFRIYLLRVLIAHVG
jgi:hypothetical protein